VCRKEVVEKNKERQKPKEVRNVFVVGMRGDVGGKSAPMRISVLRACLQSSYASSAVVFA